MRRIIYGSTAVREFSDTELLELLGAARAVNTEHSVTGMLVYADRSFLQHFEGEDSMYVHFSWSKTYPELPASFYETRLVSA